jgi:hypothetical protein
MLFWNLYTSLGGAGFVKLDAWRCMDRSRKIGKQMTGQPFGAYAQLASLAFAAQRSRLGGLQAEPLVCWHGSSQMEDEKPG